MSLHPSLRAGKGKTGAMRNVLKRHERARRLIDLGRWTEGQSAFGLAKIKVEKLKARKAAAKEAAPEAAAEGAAAPAGKDKTAPAAKDKA